MNHTLTFRLGINKRMEKNAMGKKVFRFFKIWWNIMLGAITIYPFVVTYLIPSQAQKGELISLFGWSWETWLIIFLVSIILTLLTQNWVEKYDKDASPLSNTTNTSADHRSVAMQGVNNSPVYKDSFNAFNANVPEKFYKPTKEQLAHKIGIDIQKFGEQFKRIRYKSINDRFDEYLIVSKTFETISTELLPHANIELSGTATVDLLDEIQRQLTRYSLNIGDLSQNEADRLFYGNTKAPVPRDVLDRITDARNTLVQIEQDIDSMVKQIIDISREYS